MALVYAEQVGKPEPVLAAVLARLKSDFCGAGSGKGLMAEPCGWKNGLPVSAHGVHVPSNKRRLLSTDRAQVSVNAVLRAGHESEGVNRCRRSAGIMSQAHQGAAVSAGRAEPTDLTYSARAMYLFSVRYADTGHMKGDCHGRRSLTQAAPEPTS